MNTSTSAASPRAHAGTHALEDPHAHAHALGQDTHPRVRYARPDVTETRTTWTEADVPLGYLSAAPDLARLAGGDAPGPGDDDDGDEEGEEEAWPLDDPPHGYRDPAPSQRHASMSAVGSSGGRRWQGGGGGGGCDSEDGAGSAGGSRRLSRSLEDLPTDIQEHILRCQCSCDHLGYGNFASSAPRLTNGCSTYTYIGPSPHTDHDLQEPPSDPDHGTPPSKTKDGLVVSVSVGSSGSSGGGSGGGGRARAWWVCVVVVLGAAAGVGVGVPLALRVDPGAELPQRLESARTLLRDSPLFDGHNDLPWNIRKFMHNKLHSFNFTAELKKLRPWSRSSWSHTDLPRLREGMVGAQFWVSYVPCESQRLNAVQLTIEQIDLIKRLIEQYPEDLRLATSADEVEAAFREGRIASLIGVEGGHAIQNSLGVLRALRDLGVRYLTLTHTCSTPWAECARAQESDEEDPNSPRGLTAFGKTVVREMNRLGLLVDLSHVSQATMREALQVSRAPVIFSHSSVYAICKNPRNVPDDILKRVASNGGVVMVSFYNYFLTCSKKATISDVIEHINHVRKVAGVDYVGIGADFDGINMLPERLEDVSGYPQLFAELLADPEWTEEDLKKLAGQNLLRVMRTAEQVRRDLQEQGQRPYEELPPTSRDDSCFYRFIRPADDGD
ncbi:dipeptidase 1-like isoform X2 [Eriocheir sinensis]|uniref:dipeptidase 1-like isoform X2 n=1 Tax=Eriocheir sinensis TaxID=95602 RepID=UPI0021C5F81B|nr:dipeptidase 1-like isoform X2 [Eriocheir sinensis]